LRTAYPDFRRRTGLRPFGRELVGKRRSPPTCFSPIPISTTWWGWVAALLTDSNIRLWAGHLESPRTLKDVLSGMMVEPLFPVPPDVFSSSPAFTISRPALS
jgi:hypothetical protein